jgi:hypothetical protein
MVEKFGGHDEGCRLVRAARSLAGVTGRSFARYNGAILPRGFGAKYGFDRFVFPERFGFPVFPLNPSDGE